MNDTTTRSLWRCICRRRDGDDITVICALFVLHYVLFAR